jgi:hypothetical protein
MKSHFNRLHGLFTYCIRDSSVGITTDYGLESQGSIPCKEKCLSTPPQRPDGYVAHLASYPMGTGGPLPGGEAAGT